jgi:NADPH:quinone reductase-like Zn-dependent oxidoreductase
MKLVAELGADEVIEYHSSRFEDRTQQVDVVFDGVGAETLDRSWNMLKPGGRMVTIASIDDAAEQRVKDAFFIVEPNQQQLAEVARMLRAGTLRTLVNAVVPLEQASNAYSGSLTNKRGYGKVVITIPGDK